MKTRTMAAIDLGASSGRVLLARFDGLGISLEEIHRIRTKRVEIEFAGKVPLARLQSAQGVEDLRVVGNRVHCVVRGDFEPLMEAIAHAHVVNLTSHEPSLEEIFLAYYSKDGSAAVPEEATA